MSIEQIKSDLSQAMYYPNEQGKAFTPYERVKRIWKGNSLKLFLESMGGDQHLSPLQIKEAKDGLLRTISVLVNIVPKNWEGWSRFQAIFFPLDEATAHWRRDKNATSFTKEELADDSFLGDLNMARSFSDDVWIYFPVILNEKREEESKYDSPLRVPLFQIGSEVRPGGYGSVTKELIPPNHIILRHSSDHLGIPETRHPVSLIAPGMSW
jgi:hypothetical protein